MLLGDLRAQQRPYPPSVSLYLTHRTAHPVVGPAGREVDVLRAPLALDYENTVGADGNVIDIDLTSSGADGKGHVVKHLPLRAEAVKKFGGRHLTIGSESPRV